MAHMARFWATTISWSRMKGVRMRRGQRGRHSPYRCHQRRNAHSAFLKSGARPIIVKIVFISLAHVASNLPLPVRKLVKVRSHFTMAEATTASSGRRHGSQRTERPLLNSRKYDYGLIKKMSKVEETTQTKNLRRLHLRRKKMIQVMRKWILINKNWQSCLVGSLWAKPKKRQSTSVRRHLSGKIKYSVHRHSMKWLVIMHNMRCVRNLSSSCQCADPSNWLLQA